mmetsp:Transcript_34205/g.89753  ORF Transcript_34205/g.89753 Transcript_34205/m.89753 type:complete len:211 (+) Transcript_34205:1646-2278(+)
MSVTCQKVVLHPFVHVSMTADDLFFHEEGFGGRRSGDTDDAHTASSTVTPTGKSGAPGTMSSQPEPPPLDSLLHQKPPAGVYRPQLQPPTPYVYGIGPPADELTTGDGSVTVVDKLKLGSVHPGGLIHSTPLPPRSPFSIVPAAGSRFGNRALVILAWVGSVNPDRRLSPRTCVSDRRVTQTLRPGGKPGARRHRGAISTPPEIHASSPG